MVDRIRVGDEGYALVVTGEGSCSRTAIRTRSRAWRAATTCATHPLVAQHQRVTRGRMQTAFDEYDDERGPMLGVAAHVPLARVDGHRRAAARRGVCHSRSGCSGSWASPSPSR